MIKPELKITWTSPMATVEIVHNYYNGEHTKGIRLEFDEHHPSLMTEEETTVLIEMLCNALGVAGKKSLEELTNQLNLNGTDDA